LTFQRHLILDTVPARVLPLPSLMKIPRDGVRPPRYDLRPEAVGQGDEGHAARFDVLLKGRINDQGSAWIGAAAVTDARDRSVRMFLDPGNRSVQLD
jgi:hypothetical protein